MTGGYQMPWQEVADWALYQAIQLGCAGTIVVRSDISPGHVATARHAMFQELGTLVIVVSELECHGLTTKTLTDKLLAAANPCAVGM